MGDPPVEQAVARFYPEYINADDVVVEVGARMGDGTRVLARLARHVYALEPARRSFLLLRIFTKGCKNVNAYNIGLSDHTGYAELQTDRGFSGVASLKKLADVGYISKETVRVAKLDCLTFSPPPTSLVLDCEGSEIEVLKGAEESLSAMKSVLVETHTLADGFTTLDEVVRKLGKFPFQLRVASAGNESWVLAKKPPRGPQMSQLSQPLSRMGKTHTTRV